MCSGASLIAGMFGASTEEDYQPVGWMGRYPVHVTTLLMGVHILCMILAVFVTALGAAGLLRALMFDNTEVVSGRLWQLATYAFVHPPYPMSSLLWFAVEMYMLFAFGREVERFLGRKGFIWLYALLLLLPALLLTLATPLGRFGLGGSGMLHFGIFVAFATIYPSLEMLLRIQAKWVAIVFAGLITLAAVAAHDWATLLVLWTSVGIAFGFVRFRTGGEFEWLERLKSRFDTKPKFTVVKKPAVSREEEEDLHESIDPILDKIAKSGMSSLTPRERRALDQARAKLLNGK